MKILSFFVVVIVLGMLAACAPAPMPTPVPTATPEPAHHTPATPEPTILTLWLPDWMITEDAVGLGKLLSVTDDFSTRQGVTVRLVPKLATGQGGLLDALRTTKPVAPAILPDIIVLPLQEIPLAAQDDLLQPLTERLPASLLDDAYPFARQAGVVEETWVAVPFAADFEHLSFQPAALSDPPVNWDIVLAAASTYNFPAGSSDSLWTDAMLLHYLSAVPAGEAPERNRTALRRQLDFYQTLRQENHVDAANLQAATPQISWEQSLQGVVPLAETTAHLWLGQQGDTTFLRFGPTPTYDSQARYLIHGWAYAIITADEAQQALAAQLIQRLLQAQTLAEWSHQAHILPASPTALQQWPENDYRRFADEALANGFLMPAFSRDEAMTRDVHQACRAVLSGELSADEAWTQAVADW